MTAVYVLIGILVVAAIVAYFVTQSRKQIDAGQGDAGTLPRAAGDRQVPPEAKPNAVVSPAPQGRSGLAPSERPAPTVGPAAGTIETLSAEPAPLSEPPVVRPVSVRPPEVVKRDLGALRKGLSATRGGWVQKLVGIFTGRKELDPEVLSAIEETLITGDVGMKTTQRLTETIRDRLAKRDLGDESVVWSTLRDVGREVIDVDAPAFGSRAGRGQPLVILVVGVNGVGKTTTIGKLASRYKEQGKTVYLAAADTFRAAAVAQLEAWGKRVGVKVVKGQDLSKPSAVVFDAVQLGAKEGADVVIADTAGRLHTKTPLMDELRKLRDAAGKALPGAPHEILLVLDATTGQNGLIQVKEFRDALDLTGIVLTKLDGTAKGGVILGICDEFKLPVRFVGVGEKVDDLREFDANDFATVLFSRPSDDDADVASA